MVMAARQPEPKPLGLVWIKCPHPVVILGLIEVLKQESEVHVEEKPPVGRAPSSIIFCPSEAEDPAMEVRRIRTLAPDAPVVLFGLRVNPPLIRAALRAGARGYIYADMQPAQIVRTLSLVSEGEIVVPDEILDDLAAGEAGPDIAALSLRQREILELAAEGLTNAQIGQRLFRAETTIKQHLRAAYKLLGVRNRVEAVMLLKYSG